MKKYFIIIALLIVTGCGQDDKNNSDNSGITNEVEQVAIPEVKESVDIHTEYTGGGPTIDKSEATKTQMEAFKVARKNYCGDKFKSFSKRLVCNDGGRI